jgi:hypothetical protein
MYFSKTNTGQLLLQEFCISLTCLICLFSMKTFKRESEYCLATFRLSLLAIYHFLRFSKSEFTAVSRSVIKNLRKQSDLCHQQTTEVLFCLDTEAHGRGGEGGGSLPPVCWANKASRAIFAS